MRTAAAEAVEARDPGVLRLGEEERPTTPAPDGHQERGGGGAEGWNS